jgi:hypothetical protein
MGDNVGGIAVQTGARIMAKSEPGGVLVSGTVKDLVQVPELIFKIAASTSSKGFLAGGNFSRRAPDSKKTEVKRWKQKSGLAIHHEEFSRSFQSCSNCAWWRVHPEVSRSYPGS